MASFRDDVVLAGVERFASGLSRGGASRQSIAAALAASIRTLDSRGSSSGPLSGRSHASDDFVSQVQVAAKEMHNALSQALDGQASHSLSIAIRAAQSRGLISKSLGKRLTRLGLVASATRHVTPASMQRLQHDLDSAVASQSCVAGLSLEDAVDHVYWNDPWRSASPPRVSSSSDSAPSLDAWCRWLPSYSRSPVCQLAPLASAASRPRRRRPRAVLRPLCASLGRHVARLDADAVLVDGVGDLVMDDVCLLVDDAASPDAVGGSPAHDGCYTVNEANSDVAVSSDAVSAFLVDDGVPANDANCAPAPSADDILHAWRVRMASLSSSLAETKAQADVTSACIRSNASAVETLAHVAQTD